MPVPVVRSLDTTDYSRKYSSTASCTRRTSTSNSPYVSELLSSYSTRPSYSSRSTSDERDRSQTRDSLRTRDFTRSRTSSYSSETSKTARKSVSVKEFDLNAFRSAYGPSSYIAGIHRSDLSRPPRSSEPSSRFLKDKSSSLVKEKRSDAVENTNLEVNTDGTNNLGAEGGDVGSKKSLSEVKVSYDGESQTNTPDAKQSSPDESKESSNTTVETDSVVSANIGNSGRQSIGLRKEPCNEGSGLSGLRNIGNTCFLNSVVQCLSNTRILKDYLFNKDYLSEISSETKGAGCLIKSFADVIYELWSGEGKIVNTTAFKAQIQRYAPRFMGYNQQDAQEFLRYLLEGLHDDINRVTVKPRNLPEIDDHLSDSIKANESWKQYLRCDNSKIVDLFVGQLKSTLQCTVCGHSSTTFEVFWDLSLPLPSRTGTLRLSQCIDHFTKEEVLDGDEMPTCSRCKTRRKCTKRFSIQRFPKILVLHLKRFSPSERYRKLSATVEFPLTNLDMSAYSSTPSTCSYNLYAVSNHSGSAYSGHYTAYCLHPHLGQWNEYNDSRVSSISSRNVVSSEAYILFYEQAGGVTTSRL